MWRDWSPPTLIQLGVRVNPAILRGKQARQGMHNLLDGDLQGARLDNCVRPKMDGGANRQRDARATKTAPATDRQIYGWPDDGGCFKT